MLTDDVLGATGTGLWHWRDVPGQVTMDATAARLLGFPEEPATRPAQEVRARYHPTDTIRLNSAVDRAVAGEGVASVRVRVVDEDQEPVRLVDLRMQAEWAGRRLSLYGTITEVPEPADGRGGPGDQLRETPEQVRSREAFLLDAGRSLVEAGSTDEVLQVAASLSMPGFSPSGLAIFQLDGDQLSIVSYRGFNRTNAPPFENTPVTAPYPAAEVMRTGRPIYVGSREEYQERYPASYPMVEPFGQQSWAYLPLIVNGKPNATWMVTFTYKVSFDADERSVLTSIARMISQALSRTTVSESQQALSAGLHEAMMPETFPEIPGMTIVGRYIPTGGGLQVGGDWHNVIPLPSGRYALVIGDVQGHDIQAAIVMSQLRLGVRAYAAEGHSPDAVLARASYFLSSLVESLPEEADNTRFATCLYLEIDPATGALDIARAGHLDPAVRLPDGTLLLRHCVGGLPLGLFRDSEYPVTRIVLEPGETLMLYTDGLIETGGHDLDTGWQRLVEVSTESAAARPPSAADGRATAALEQFADALIQSVYGATSHHRTGPLSDRREDDIALLLMYREEPGGPGEEVRRIVLTVAQTEPAMISEARRQLRVFMHDWAVADQVQAAMLMLSEALANVLKHTDSDAVVVCELSGEEADRLLRVEVNDSSDQLPARRDPGELASSGRGLTLLAMLAESWGVEPRGVGKYIWFELAESAPAPEWKPEL